MHRAASLAACVVIAIGGAAIGALAVPPSGLRGHYYSNLTRSGQPIAVTIDRSLSTDTLDNGVAGVWQAYSVEWSGFLVIDRAATYQFSVMSDDGSELEVADQVVVSNGGAHGPQEAHGAIELAAGVHPIRLRYEQMGGGFSLAVKFARAGEPLTDLPASRLLPDATSYANYRLRRAMPLVGAIVAVFLWIVALRARPTASSLVGPRWLAALDRPAVAIGTIVAVGVAVRVFVMLGSDAILWGDSDVFIETFGAIRSGRFLDHDPHRTLLYPYFLTAFLVWSGEPPMDQVIVGAQHLLGVVSAVALFIAGRQVFGSRVALAGALLLTVHTTQLFYELSILSETLFTCLLALSLIPLTALVAQPTMRRVVIGGVACAALTLTRPVAEWFVLIPLALTVIVARTWRDRLRFTSGLLVTYLAIMLPWAMVNQRQFRFFGVAIGRGFGMSIRVFDIDRLPPPARSEYPELREIITYAAETQYSPATFLRDELRRRRHSAIEADEIMYRVAVESVFEHPWTFAVNSFKEWGFLLAGPLVDEAICGSINGPYVCSRRTQGYAREPFLNRPRSAHEPVRPWVVAFMRHWQIPMGAAVVLAVFGFISSLLERHHPRRQAVFLALVIAYFSFLPAFAQSPQDRYRLPIDGLLFMFAVFGLTRLVRQLFAYGEPGTRRMPLGAMGRSFGG